MPINTGDLSQMYLKPEGADRVERDRRARLERDTASLRQRAPELGESLLQVFETLPAALSEAAASELKRLRERYGSEHPRVRHALRQHEQLQAMVGQTDAGAARARHLLEFTQLEGRFFHGVIADTQSAPLADIGLRIEMPRGQEPREGRSGADGYFRIALPRSGNDDAGGNEPASARVLLLNADGSTAHADPLPLTLDGATHYREYRIEPPRGCGDPRPPKPTTPTAPSAPGGTRPSVELGSSTPLEHVRGIGPKRAERLREAGIADIEALLATDPGTLVEVLGFDIGPTREEAERVLAEHRRAKEGSGVAREGTQTSTASTGKTAANEKTQPERSSRAAKKPSRKD